MQLRRQLARPPQASPNRLHPAAPCRISDSSVTWTALLPGGIAQVAAVVPLSKGAAVSVLSTSLSR